MSKAGAAVRRGYNTVLEEHALVSELGLRKAAEEEHDLEQEQKVEVRIRWLAGRLRNLFGIETTPHVTGKYAGGELRYTPEMRVVAEHDGITFGWLAKYKNDPEDVCVITGECKGCGKPELFRVRDLEELGYGLNQAEGRKYICSTCKDK